MRNQNCNSVKKSSTPLGTILSTVSTALGGALLMLTSGSIIASEIITVDVVSTEREIVERITVSKTNKDVMPTARNFYYNSDSYFNFYVPKYNSQHTASDSAGELVKITVFDNTEKRTLPIYRNNGRLYVVGFPGHEYSVSVRNQAREDVLAVTTVDGINAINGNSGDFLDTGYVIGPYQKLPITGWRKSLDHSAKFYFTKLNDGYASSAGRANDVGVLGVAVFRKKEFMPFYPHEANNDTIQVRSPSTIPSRGNESEYVPNNSPARSMDYDNKVSPSIGTGHGEVTYSPVKRSFFPRRTNSPEEIVRIYYNSFENLVNMGILVRPQFEIHHQYIETNPSAFPRNDKGGIFRDPR